MERLEGDDESDESTARGKEKGLKAVPARNVERFAGTCMRGLLGEDMVGQGNLDVLVKRTSALMCTCEKTAG